MKTQVKEYCFLGLLFYLSVLSSRFIVAAVWRNMIMVFLKYLGFKFSSYLLSKLGSVSSDSLSQSPRKHYQQRHSPSRKTNTYSPMGPSFQPSPGLCSLSWVKDLSKTLTVIPSYDAQNGSSPYKSQMHQEENHFE